MAAKAARGMRLRSPGINSTLASNKIPWKTADVFVLAPEVILAELRRLQQ